MVASYSFSGSYWIYRRDFKGSRGLTVKNQEQRQEYRECLHCAARWSRAASVEMTVVKELPLFKSTTGPSTRLRLAQDDSFEEP